MTQQDLAGAIAFFESSDDLELLRETLRLLRPKAARAVSAFERDKKAPPPPLDVDAAASPSSRDAALRFARNVSDFAQLQALSRAVGRRVEGLQAG